MFLFILYFIFDFFYFLLFFLFFLVYSFLNFSWAGFFFMFDSYSFIALSVMSLFILSLIMFSEMNFVLVFLSQVLVLICVFFFFSSSLIFLYVFFEASLFPIVLMILGYGSQIEKISSSYYLMFYAAFCSFPFLFVYFNYGLLNFLVYFDKVFSWELVFILSLGFLMKFPVYFLHLWLPKAHVEAPTSASMLLAGLLLKLGTAGFFRILKSLSFLHLNFWFFISLLGMVLGAFTCSFQSDSKSLAAYSSITHMSFTLLCLVLFSLQSKSASLMLMLAHGYTSTLMFFFIGEFYHISGTRVLYFFNSFLNLGLLITILFSLVFLSNAGVPPTLSFFSEFVCILLSVNSFNYFFFMLFFYFVVSFYYSIFFLTNFFMGKSYYNIFYWSSFFSSFMVFMMFNFFWICIFL